LVAGAGAVLLDAPVSGSVPVVERGQLTVMVGGDPAALARVRPVLATFAAQVFHLGPLVAKDVGLIQSLAARVGARLDLLAASSAVVDEARANGYGPRDMATVAEYMRSR
jgi:3-hydroxyisobutyrate dehydrogenase-like beta-hydroxyacid dehydrogenase